MGIFRSFVFMTLAVLFSYPVMATDDLKSFYERIKAAKSSGKNLEEEREAFRVFFNQQMQSNRSSFSSTLTEFRDNLTPEERKEFQADLNQTGGMCTQTNCRNRMELKFSSYEDAANSAAVLNDVTVTGHSGVGAEKKNQMLATERKVLDTFEKGLQEFSIKAIKIIAEEHPEIYKSYANGDREVLEGIYGLRTDDRTFAENLKFIKTRMASGELPAPTDCSTTFVSPKCALKENAPETQDARPAGTSPQSGLSH